MKKYSTYRIILNLLTGERFITADTNPPPTISELLAHALNKVNPDAPDGFAALLECAGEPRYRKVGDVTYNNAAGYGATRCDYRTIVVSFPGCHFAARSETTSGADVITSKINAEGDEAEHNAYTPEQNIRGLIAINMVDTLRNLTENEQAAADKARAAYIDNIAEE
jgi:hypothetical protein